MRYDTPSAPSQVDQRRVGEPGRHPPPSDGPTQLYLGPIRRSWALASKLLPAPLPFDDSFFGPTEPDRLNWNPNADCSSPTTTLLAQMPATSWISAPHRSRCLAGCLDETGRGCRSEVRSLSSDRRFSPFPQLPLRPCSATESNDRLDLRRSGPRRIRAFRARRWAWVPQCPVVIVTPRLLQPAPSAAARGLRVRREAPQLPLAQAERFDETRIDLVAGTDRFSPPAEFRQLAALRPAAAACRRQR